MSLLDRMRSIGEGMEGAAAESAAPAALAHPSTRKPATGNGDPEIKAMNLEAPLIDLIRTDTGEIGRQMGDYVAFERCPICGHRDCFRWFPDTNTWACFGESNGTGYKGGSYIEYQRLVHDMTPTEAVRALRDATGHHYEGDSNDTWYDFEGNIVSKKPGGGADPNAPLHLEGGVVVDGPEPDADQGDADKGEKESQKLCLPPWEAVRAVDPPKRAPVLIDGILRRGHVGLICAKGKAGKSLLAIELSIAVATGGEWLGFKCGRGRTLYIDPELDAKSLDNRFASVARAMGADPAEVQANVVRWSLRGILSAKGEPANVADIAHDVEARCDRGDFALVVLDTASALIEGGDENSSIDVRKFFNNVLRIPKATGAAVLVVHHFGKGDAGDRASIDRSRGSSVWGDSPDAPISLTEIFPKEGKPADYLAEHERAFVLEDSGLREFPSIEPLHIIYSYPVHRVDERGITADWKPRTSHGGGGTQTGKGNRSKSEARADKCIICLLSEFVARGIGREGIPAKDAAEWVSDAMGETVKAGTLKRYVEASAALDVWQKSERRWLVVPTRLPPKTDPEGDGQESLEV